MKKTLGTLFKEVTSRFSTKNLLTNRRNMLLIALVGGIVFLAIMLKPTSCRLHGTLYQMKTIKVNNTNHRLLVADNVQKWEKGLMNVKSRSEICKASGMVFEFPTTVPQVFWNKNTITDLTLYWMQDNVVIGTSSLYSINKFGSQIVSSPKPANRVVEIIVSEK